MVYYVLEVNGMLNRVDAPPVWIISATLLLILLIGLFFSTNKIIAKEKVQDYPMETAEQVTPLNGKWEFYWEQLLTPTDFPSIESHPNSSHLYIHVPAAWKSQKIDGERLPSHGYGTYRLQLEIPQDHVGQNKALYIGHIGTAYRLWIDGQEMESRGIVGKNKDGETAELRANLVFFEPKEEIVEIIVQVSNFSFREGGILDSIKYADPSNIIPNKVKGLAKQLFIIGGFFFIGLYHLIIFGIRTREKSILMIGFIGILGAIRMLFVNEYITYLVFPHIPWEVMVKIEYLAEYIGFLCFILLLKYIFPSEVKQKVVTITYVYTTFMTGYILLTPARIFTETMPIQISIMLVILAYFVFHVGIKAIVRKKEGALIYCISVLIIIIGTSNDVLNHIQLMNTFYVIEYCVLLFLLLQAVMVAYRYNLLFNKNEYLNEELTNVNDTLEEKVEERTKELNDKNMELENVQSSSRKMLSNIAHDLGTPIIAIQTHLQLMKRRKNVTSEHEIIDQLLDKTNYINRLVVDLFELSKLQSNQLSFHKEKIKLKAFMDVAYQKLALNVTSNDRILQRGKLETTIDENEVFINIDQIRIMQVLSNYLENAMKFSSPDKEIMINCYIVTNENRDVCIEVVDKGIGIEEKDCAKVFQRYFKKGEENVKGSGLGLAICKEIIEQHGGKVGVRSEVGKGSTFYFLLPMY
ncbi:ATP-binding protein [Evansella sp. AB-rgal1]|uniref:sensor histidine kinase n=1 Tax=Evansella sp. AB-rgal1 TaxID=3242696 RepID=UPI00359D50A2